MPTNLPRDVAQKGRRAAIDVLRAADVGDAAGAGGPGVRQERERLQYNMKGSREISGQRLPGHEHDSALNPHRIHTQSTPAVILGPDSIRHDHQAVQLPAPSLGQVGVKEVGGVERSAI